MPRTLANPIPPSLLPLVLDLSPDGVLVERGNVIVWINAAYCRILGGDAADLIGHETLTIVAAEDQRRLADFAAMRDLDGTAPLRYRFRARRGDDSLVQLEAGVSSLRVGEELFIVTIVRETEHASESRGIGAFERLSKRERDVALRTLSGERPKAIAFALGISEKTVATHRCRIFRKLGLRHDLDLFRMAAESGFLPDASGQLSADRRPAGHDSDS